MGEEIAPDDEVARCLIYPQFFEGSLHVNGKLWEFNKRAEDGASHQSAVLKRLAPEDDGVNRIGCKIASIGNARLGSDVPAEKKRYYCGFRCAPAGSLSITTEEYRVELSLKPEFDEEAHIDVALFIPPETSKNRQANLRTAAGLALAENFGAATTYVCANDIDDDNHPFVRLGSECIHVGLVGPWQGKTVHLSDLSLVDSIVEGAGWPGLAGSSEQ